MPDGPKETGGAGRDRREALLEWIRAQAHDPGFRLVERFVGEGQTVVDVGAGIGLYTSKLAELVGPSGRVHAFEPNPERRRALEALAETHSAIEFHAVALSDHEGEEVLQVPVHRGESIPACGRLSPPPTAADGVSWDRRTVMVTTLDRELGDESFRVGFVKCDVEGHELAVLRGAERTLRKARPALLIEIEERHSEVGVEATFEHLLALGYNGWAIAPEGPRPLDRFDLERDQLAFVSGFKLGAMPSGYINDFLFAPPSLDAPRLLASEPA
jgi:FkbM family methyltransferase